MADLFISYAREDQARAAAIAAALEQDGFTVFWDSEIPAGQTWADYIETKLRNSAAVLVLWSAHSIQSQWVREEARMGRDAGKLIPVQLDGSLAPFGFGEVQAANLQNWTGDRSGADWQRLVGAIRFAIEKNGQTPPAPRPISPPPAPPPPVYTPQPAYAAPPLASGAPAAEQKGAVKPIWIISSVALGALGLIAVLVAANSGGSGSPPIPSGGDVSYSQTTAGAGGAGVDPGVAAMADAALEAESDGNDASDEAAAYYAQGAEAANAGMAGRNGYGMQQLPDGTTLAGDLSTLMGGGTAAVGVSNAAGIQFYGLYQQITATDYTMTGRGGMGSAVADGHWVYSAATYTFTGRASLQGRYVVAGREQGPATGVGGEGVGAITYSDGSRFVGQYRSTGVGDQAQYLRHGAGVMYAANGAVMESGVYQNDNWVSAQ